MNFKKEEMKKIIIIMIFFGMNEIMASNDANVEIF